MVLLGLGITPARAHAGWPRLPDVNLPVGTGVGLQVHPSILEDGAGGAFIAWHDNRGSSYDLYIQRVSATGVPLWTANGVALCSAAGDQANTQMVPDGAGGVIVAWHDYRAGNWDVYVQRLNANGVAQWTANGVALCTAAGHQTDPNLVSDGQGGAIVTWPDERSGTRVDVYARRVNAAGAPQWTANGVLVCGASGTRGGIRLVSDGASGAIITWDDARLGVDNSDIYAQRLNGSGVPQWLADGALISEVEESNDDPAILSDGSGGAFIAWLNSQSGYPAVKMQRVNAGGAKLWNSAGVYVGGAGLIELSVQLASDGAGGAIAAWMAWTGVGTDRYWVYAQRVSSTGSLRWATYGVKCSTTGLDHFDPRPTSDGAGGAIITWYLANSAGIHAQRVNSTGAVVWGSAGLPVSDAIGDRAWPRIAADAAGGAIVTWHDTRNGPHDVYAQRVDHYGYLGNVEAVVTSVRDVPNDQGGKVKVSWNASPLDADPTYTISDYRLWRSVPEVVALGNTDPKGARAMTRDPDIAATENALLLTASAGSTYAWEYVTSQPAAALPAYSLTTFTTGDSIPGSNPLTRFMVEARAGAAVSSPHWFSAPDSGYSIDNLAPAVPSSLAGSFANGTTALSWAANGEADLASYRLYRGTSAGFTPSPANRIASPTGTSYTDPSGAPSFYKLSAVDIHGNESGFALLTPAGTLDAPSDGRPVSLRLGVPGPNPAASRARIAFDVPRPQELSLVVFDATGRAVRVLHRGAHPAGSFHLDWDLRDDAGRGVANGVYFVRLECEGRTITRRLIAMR